MLLIHVLLCENLPPKKNSEPKKQIFLLQMKKKKNHVCERQSLGFLCTVYHHEESTIFTSYIASNGSDLITQCKISYFFVAKIKIKK